MMAGTFASRVLGLLREIMTAAYFGATAQLDAFNIAYTLANLSRQLLAEGALSAAFVPVFSKILIENGKEKALSLARQAMSVLMTAALAVTILGIFFSPMLIKIMAPGFGEESAALAVSLTRWLFPFLFVISVAALAMGMLNSLGSFFVPAIAPAVSNLCFIVILPFTVPFMGIYSLVAVVLLGGISNFLSQWLWGIKTGAALLPEKPNIHDPNLKRMMQLFIPYAAGLSLNQVNPVLSRMFASFLEEGAISALNYSNRVIQLPLGLFVIAVSQAVLPQLSQIPKKDTESFRKVLSDAMRFVLFIVLPATAISFLYSDEIVNLLFVRGAFGQNAWEATSLALAMSMLGLPGMACSTVVMRGLYALGLAKGAFFNTLVSVVCTLAASMVLLRPFGLGGLALAPSIAFTTASIYGIYEISKNLRSKNKAVFFPIKWVLKTALCLIVLVALTITWKYIFPYNYQASFGVKSFNIISIFSLSAAVYATMTFFMKFEEWYWIIGAVRKK